MDSLKLDHIKAGDLLIFDGSTGCISPGELLEAQADANGNLYVSCTAGKHFLNGMIDDNDILVGVQRRSASPSSVLVKGLEWGQTSYGAPEATSVSGIYRITNAWDGGFNVNRGQVSFRGDDGRSNFPTVEAAKAAAQSDYERRILSALTAAPQTETTQVEEAWHPIATADKSIAVDMQLPGAPRMLHSYPIWVRREGGKPFEASWVQRKPDSPDGYWWDWDREDVADPDEWMPHPLQPIQASTEGATHG